MRRRTVALLALLTIVVGAAAAFGVLELRSRGWSIHEHAKPLVFIGPGFTLKYPKSWEHVAPPAGSNASGPAVGALRDESGTAFIVIRRERPTGSINAAFVHDLDTKLRATVPDYRPVRAEILHLKGGAALFYSYVRTRTGTLATITVIPAGDHSFAIDTASPAGEQKVAAEIGQIVRSFTTT